MTAAPARQTGAVFDLADRELAVGDRFRWPCGVGAVHWRITEVLDPEVDDVVQRVRAVPAMEVKAS